MKMLFHRAVACLFADVTLGKQRWGFSNRTCARSSFVKMCTQSSYPNFPRKMDDIQPFNAATKSYVAFERFAIELRQLERVLITHLYGKDGDQLFVGCSTGLASFLQAGCQTIHPPFFSGVLVYCVEILCTWVTHYVL